jgi:hypothetical protein
MFFTYVSFSQKLRWWVITCDGKELVDEAVLQYAPGTTMER